MAQWVECLPRNPWAPSPTVCITRYTGTCHSNTRLPFHTGFKEVSVGQRISSHRSPGHPLQAPAAWHRRVLGQSDSGQDGVSKAGSRKLPVLLNPEGPSSCLYAYSSQMVSWPHQSRVENRQLARLPQKQSRCFLRLGWWVGEV